ncbi:unnamed protein product [Mytilus coruscus]|uniref:B box-type domain-containing protein n=1 Tax=Mytilus coruscus TaxID=42192 RepID=A0A6J8D009_MYTCO|nr:unnamed protein product [Mytilus coruscus]
MHDILALKDIRSHIEDIDIRSEFKPVKCKDQRKQLCCMYCITCEILVCPKCIAKTHHTHVMMEIQTVCQMKVEGMKKMQDQAHNKVEKFIEKLNLMAETEKLKSNDIEQKMLEEEKHGREFHSQCLRLLEEHKEKTKRQFERLSKKESEVLEEETDIEMVMHQVENIHKSKNTEKILGAVSSLRTNWSHLSR